jgi:hypothetical protein
MKSELLTDYEVWPKKYATLFFPTVSNGERVGKLSAVVEGTFMCMRDFFAASQYCRMCLPLVDSEVV